MNGTDGVYAGGFWIQLGTAHRHSRPARPVRAREEEAPQMAAEMIRDDPGWLYQGWCGYLSTRRLRVWRIGPGHLVAVVSEGSGDSGTSITNAAEAVHAQLRAEYPGERVDVIEHWLDSPSLGGHRHYDAVTILAGGLPVWKRMPVAELRTILGSTLGDDGDEDEPLPGEPRATPDPDGDQVDLGGRWSLFRVERDDPRIDPRFQSRDEE